MEGEQAYCPSCLYFGQDCNPDPEDYNEPCDSYRPEEDVMADKQESAHKPRCKLIGTDGNVFSLTAKASEALKKAGMADKAKEMRDKVFASRSYNEALNIIGEYVDIH